VELPPLLLACPLARYHIFCEEVHMKALPWRARLILALCASLTVWASAPVLAQQEPAQKEAAPAGALGPAETLSGSIMMADADKKILIVKSAAGIPYSFVLTSATRITEGNQRLKIADLTARVNQQVNVRFLPTRRGNLARSVQINP